MNTRATHILTELLERAQMLSRSLCAQSKTLVWCDEMAHLEVPLADVWFMALSAAPVETFAPVPPAQNRFSLSLSPRSFSPSNTFTITTLLICVDVTGKEFSSSSFVHMFLVKLNAFKICFFFLVGNFSTKYPFYNLKQNIYGEFWMLHLVLTFGLSCVWLLAAFHT